MQVKVVQHGIGPEGPVNPITGVPACGDEALDDDELAANRADFGNDIRSHPLDDDYHRDRSPRWDRIRVPMLTAGNWGGQGLHLRGNVEGFVRAASEEKWLELHGLEHWTHFYTDYGVALQKQFFGCFLKGEDNGWRERPPVLLQVRHLDHFEERAEDGWPLIGTEWTRFYLDPAATALVTSAPADGGSVTYEPSGDGVTFYTAPFEHATEITGPSAATLFVSTATEDTDLFVVLRLFDPGGDEVTFQGAIDPHTPIGQGWLRASHRELDPILSTPYRPYHPHTTRRPLTPGHVYELAVEIWPTSIVVPEGHRLALTVRGRDYEHDLAGDDARLGTFKNPLRGCGPFLHDDPRDRPRAVFGGETTLWTGPDHPSSVLLPVIPPRR